MVVVVVVVVVAAGLKREDRKFKIFNVRKFRRRKFEF